MKKIIIWALTLSMLLALSACAGATSGTQANPGADGNASAAAGKTVQLSCGAAGTTSWVYSCVTAASEILKQYTNIDLVVQSTPGSTVHYGMIANNEIQMGSGFSPTDYWAWNGIGELFPQNYEGEFYTIVPLTTSYFYCFVRADSSIQSISDLAGKTVFVGDPGSASAAGIQDVLKGLGIDQAFRQISTDRDEGFAMLKDNRVDAAMYIGSAPYSSILSIAADVSLRFIPLTTEEQEKAIKTGPYNFAGAIGKDSYDFLTEDVPTLCMIQNINVDSDMDEALVYEMTKTLVEHWDELVAVVAGAGQVDPLVDINNCIVPIHPGAIRYYEEQGVTIKDCLRP